MRLRCPAFALLFILLCSAADSRAQQRPTRFEHFTTKDGLGADIVYGVVQDRYGYLWVAGNSGLDRYDGAGFRHFSHNPADSFSLPYDQSRMVCDKQGNLWVYSEKGIAFFDATRERFIRLNLNEKKEEFTVTTMLFDAENNLWYFTGQGRLKKRDHRNFRTEEQYNKQGTLAFKMVEDSRRRLWLATDQGLILFNRKTKKAQIYKDDRPGASNQFFSIFQDNPDSLWLCTWGTGLQLFLPATGKFYTFPINTGGKDAIQNYPSSVIASPGNKDELWIASIDPDIGIAVFNKKTGAISYLNHDASDPNSIASNAGIQLFRDRAGIIWYATEKGLSKYDPHMNRFRELNLNHIPGLPPDLGITCLRIEGSTIWIGTSGNGVYALDAGEKKLIRHIDLSAFSEESNVIHHLTIDSDKVWIASYKGSYVFQRSEEKISQLPVLQDAQVYSILASDKKYWMATNIGLFGLSSLSGRITDSFLYNATVDCLYEDAKKNLWVGTSIGLCSLSKGKFHEVVSNGPEYQLLKRSVINDIDGDNKGNIFMATSSGIAWYQEGGQLKFFTKADGLAQEVCSRIRLVQDSLLCVLQTTGLSMLNFRTGAINNYGQAEGLDAPTFENGGLAITDAGDMIFGRYISLYFARPQQIEKNDYRAPVYITSVHADDSLIAAKGKWYSIPNSYHRVSFEFALLNFTNSGENTYEYQLEGSDDDWVPAGKRTYISYSNLPPGNYVFKVRGKNSDGVYSSNIATARFNIVPAFWQTGWFSSMLLMVSLVLIALTVRGRDKMIKRKTVLRYEMMEAKTKALRSQMNPHFIFNCLNTIDSYVLQNKQQDASQLIQRFSKLTRRILEHTTHDFITIQQELETLNIYLEIEQIRKAKQFEFVIEAEPGIVSCLIPPMLLQPFVENAIVHGMKKTPAAGGFISVVASKENNNISIVIEDNGIGRKKAMELKQAQPQTHRSLSMEITMQRLEALYGHNRHEEYIRITDHEEPETGTHIEIIIPAKKEDHVKSDHT